jgi:CRP-like cAMP-binding protein
MHNTRQSFLEYIAQLYSAQQRHEDIVLKDFTQTQKLIEQGEQPQKVFLIKSGITKCYIYEDNDKEYIVEFLGRGEIIGEIEAVTKIPALCTVEAITNVQVYAMPISYFRDLMEKDLQLNRLLIDTFAQRVINTASRASFQQLYTIEHSLSKLLQLSAKLDIKLSKDDMAAYLGINVRSLNRALKNVGG